MQDFISDNSKAVLLALIAVVAGITLTIRVIRKRNSDNNNYNKTIQKNNTVGGDQAGRDINKK